MRFAEAACSGFASYYDLPEASLFCVLMHEATSEICRWEADGLGDALMADCSLKEVLLSSQHSHIL